MEPCHRTSPWRKTVWLQGLPPLPVGAERVGCLPLGEPKVRMYPPVQVSHGFSGVLHQEEGRNPLTCSGLPGPQCDRGEKQVPSPTHLRADRETPRGKVFHQAGHTVGLQQHLDEGRR